MSSNFVKNCYNEKKEKKCLSCYVNIPESYSLCFTCNKDKVHLKACNGTKKGTGEPCKLVTKNTYCLYHRNGNKKMITPLFD